MQRNWKARHSWLQWQPVFIVNAGPLVYSFLDVEDIAQPYSKTVSLPPRMSIFRYKRLQRFKTGTWCNVA